MKISTLKENKIIKNINEYLSSNYFLITMAILTLLANIFSLELVSYTFIIIFACFTCLFHKDLLPLTSLPIFAYITSSASNNPGSNETSIYASNGWYLAVLVIVFLAFFIPRMIIDKEIGFKAMFTTKRKLLLGMLVLSGAYFVSGIFSPNFKGLFGRNIFFAFAQFACIVVFYFLFTCSIKWKSVKKDYICHVGLIVGLTVVLELLALLIKPFGIISNGVINKDKIIIGWGISNNIGAVICICLPFAFYLAATQKFGFVYAILAHVLFGGILLTLSLNAVLVAVIIYVISVIIIILKGKNVLSNFIVCASFVLIVFLISIIFSSQVSALLNGVINREFIDEGRIEMYSTAWSEFKKNPIFGKTFYFGEGEYRPKGWGVLIHTDGFIPHRWHNTVLQLLVSCGIVGLLAYGFHRYQTIKMFFKKPSMVKTFIGLSVLALLLMSLLDCHFFNLGPTLLYSIFLAFAEKLDSGNDQENNKTLKKEAQK